jgi:uncharacterized protein YbjT (DUF2867 family)
VIPQPLVLLTGATGYVGGRLLRELQRARARVRCLARRAGLAYWYGIYPLHRPVFEGTLRGIAAAAEGVAIAQTTTG